MIDRRGYLSKELAHVVMETKKSRDLLSASWRIRSVSYIYIHIMQCESEGLRKKRALVEVLESEGRRTRNASLRADDGHPSSKRKRENLFFSFFSSLQALNRGDDAHLQCRQIFIQSID